MRHIFEGDKFNSFEIIMEVNADKLNKEERDILIPKIRENKKAVLDKERR